MFYLELWSAHCPKKSIFYNFVLISARNLSPLKQLTQIHLKVLNTPFEKMLWFIGVCATDHEILAIKISKKMLTQQKFNKMFRLQTLISPETVSQNMINNTIF